MMICGSDFKADEVAACVSNDGNNTIELPRINDKISAFLISSPF
jgi:hypothetical protein